MRTYGWLRFGSWRGVSSWCIDAEPHVIIRAKRVFGQAKQQSGRILLTESADVCRDLAWFLERYPLQMTPSDAARLEAGASAHRERETLVDELVRGMRSTRPFKLALEPREYQRVAAELLLQAKSLLLADEVGLGKTVTAICALTEPDTRPALIVTLTHLTRQWERELQRFAPELHVHVLKSRAVYDLRDPRGRKRDQMVLPGTFPDVIVTSYSKLAGWGETLSPLVRSVIYDEVQELRRGQATEKGTAAAVISDACTYRLGLSATPIYNYGSEIWNVMRFIAPGHLGTRSEFLTEWCGETDARGNSLLKNAKAFGTYLRESGVMLRRTRADVGRELPELTRVPHEVECDAQPLKDIQNAAHELAQIILAKNETARGQKLQAAEDLSSLVRHATGVAKAPYVAEFVRLLLENGEPVVLYGWHRDVYGIWIERLKNYRPVLYTGSESVTQKDEAARKFVSGETNLFVMSLRSGAGLDGLQGRCQTVVFGELDWSPGVHEQCVGRVHRDGQRLPVVAYYMIANEGSDPIVADVLGVKRAQVEGIRDPKGELIQNLETNSNRIRILAQKYLEKRPRATGAAVYSLNEARKEQPRV